MAPFFSGIRVRKDLPSPGDAANAQAQSQVASLIFAYRSQGHFIADLDPLGNRLETHPDLALDRFGMSEADLKRVFDTGHLVGPQQATLEEILSILQDTYCRTVGVQYTHIQDVAIRRWLQAEMEPVRNHPPFSREAKLEILRGLTDADLFETFLQTRYPGQKRFSLEGGNPDSSSTSYGGDGPRSGNRGDRHWNGAQRQAEYPDQYS